MTCARRIAAATIAAVCLLYEAATSFMAYTADACVQSDLVAVPPRVSGRVIAVAVADDQTVTQGDLLATIVRTGG
jgi:multidrug efflux system membrane fusion protein